MPFTENQKTIANDIFKNDARLRTALARLARNERVKKERPNFHNWISLMHTAAEQRIARGVDMLSPAQRQRTFNEVVKMADYLVTLRVATPVPFNSGTAIAREDAEMQEAERYAQADAE